MFKRTYFIRSINTGPEQERLASSWQVQEVGFFEKLTQIANQYRHEKENEFGGVCMITEFRRIK